jgi:hypothetical protein
MINSCPHCRSALKLGEAQLAKLQKALVALEPGKKLTIKCPACLKPILLDANGSAATTGAAGSGPAKPAITPPGPPDLGWLKEGNIQDEGKAEDTPMALLLFPEGQQLELVRDAIEAVGYQVVRAKSVQDARERMRFVNYACIVLHSHFEGPNLEKSEFHNYIREMTMNRRRYLFYILIGPEFNTLYNLQALVNSANLVVNEKDLLHLGIALRRAIPIYEELFGAYMEELTSAGRS